MADIDVFLERTGSDARFRPVPSLPLQGHSRTLAGLGSAGVTHARHIEAGDRKLA